jgi:hypothetical protein
MKKKKGDSGRCDDPESAEIGADEWNEDADSLRKNLWL